MTKSDRHSPLIAALALLLTACSTSRPQRLPAPATTLECAGQDRLSTDPPVAVRHDSVTAGGPAAVAQFHWTALADRVTSGMWGTEDRSILGTIDSLGRTRVSFPRAGRYPLRTRVLGSVTRLDTLTIPPDSTVWVRIGLARASVLSACATTNESDRSEWRR